MKLIDLSHPFLADMPVFPGDTVPEFTVEASFEKDNRFNSRVHTGMHVGTHIDAPAHFIPDGKRIADFEPDAFVGDGLLIDVRGQKTIHADILNDIPLTTNHIVLLYTGWSQKFGSDEYFQDWPVITGHFAERLVMAGIKMVGFDSPSPDKDPYPAHRILLGGDVLIIENLTNLGALRTMTDFEISALPPKIATEASMVRVVARLN